MIGMTITPGPLDLGFIIWAITTALTILIFAASAIRATILWTHDEEVLMDHPFIFFGALMSAFIAFMLSVGAVDQWPLTTNYHRYYVVTGTAQSITARMQDQTQNYLVTIDGQDFRVDDTRAAGLHPGDHVTLSCQKEWQYQGADGWACQWGAKR